MKNAFEYDADIAELRFHIYGLQQEIDAHQRVIGAVADTIPLDKVLAATCTNEAFVQYFKDLHAERDQLKRELDNEHSR